MATASKRPEKTEVIVVDKGGVTLELTNEEASILSGILGQFVSGGSTSPIFHALGDAGVSSDRGYVRTAYEGAPLRWEPAQAWD